MKKGFLIIASLGMLLLSNTPSAATAWLKAKPNVIFADSKSYGGCMVSMSKAINTTGLDCPGYWLTLDCEGSLDGNSKSTANTKMNLIQLAYVTGDYLNIFVDDSKKINGYCFAPRVDISRY